MVVSAIHIVHRVSNDQDSIGHETMTCSTVCPVEGHGHQLSTMDAIIPKGTMVLIPQIVIGRNPKIFGDDANAFRPDRWIHAR